MNKNPTVSVIIPTYNRAHLIGRAIQSVLNQTYQDFELIIVDDGSTDNTEDIIKEFQKKDERIKRIRHDKNKGGSAARNTGIKAAKGDYIAFLDSDDEWLPQKINKQIVIFKERSSKIGAVYTGFLYLDKYGNRIKNAYIPRKKGYIYEDLLLKNCVGTCSTLLIRKECFKQVGLFDEKLPASQDWDMWIRISRYYEYDFLENSFVKYRVHFNQISTNLNSKVRAEMLMQEKYIDQLKNRKYVYSNSCFTIGILLLYLGRIKNGQKYLIKAIIIYPFCIKYYIYLFFSFFGLKGFKFFQKLKNISI